MVWGREKVKGWMMIRGRVEELGTEGKSSTLLLEWDTYSFWLCNCQIRSISSITRRS